MRENYMPKALLAGKKELLLRTASFAVEKWQERLRSQKGPEYLRPDLAHADLKSNCPRMSSLLHGSI